MVVKSEVSSQESKAILRVRKVGDRIKIEILPTVTWLELTKFCQGIGQWIKKHQKKCSNIEGLISDDVKEEYLVVT